jgi:amidohydrolase
VTLLAEAHALAPDLVATRRELHRHPELGFEESKTSALVAARLAALGLPVKRGVGRTGVVAELSNGPGRRVALRADMDALPIQEEGEHDYRSTVPGVMHACGHDAHTSALLGAAKLLVEARGRGELPRGSVRFLFQPSEERSDGEGKSGAVRIVEDGAMEGVDGVAGLHVWAHLPRGKLFLSDGPVMAGSQEIFVEVRGKSAHAARAHEGVDALLLAAQGVTLVQQAVSRRISPMESGVLHFGRIQGGTAQNVLADRVTLDGTLRYFEDAVRARLEDTLRAVFGGLERLGAGVTVRLGPGYPPVVNDPVATATVRGALEGLAGAEAVVPLAPMMAAEDFAYLARSAPGVFVGVGAALPDAREHHHPRFDIDETVLPLAAASLATAAVALLREG